MASVHKHLDATTDNRVIYFTQTEIVSICSIVLNRSEVTINAHLIAEFSI